jgi:cytidine diphosphoramidate kinase
MIIWLIGLSGAGKTTVGRQVYDRVRTVHANTVFLDGDILRDVWGDRLGHDVAGRRRNAERISRLCAMLDRQGIHVVAAVLSIFPDWQAWNRRTFSAYYEVFLDTPLEVVKARDAKGLYAAAEQAISRGETADMVGLDIPMPVPPQADLHVRSPAVLAPPAQLAEMIFAACGVGAPRRPPVYPYVAPAPFAAKIDYSYAACAAPDYLDGWRASRDAARRRLSARACAPVSPAPALSPAPAPVPAPAGRGDVALADLLAGDGPDGLWLERLIQKYEIFGRLFCAYAADGRRLPDAAPATPAAYLAFAKVLTARVGGDNGLQPLSTLLKLMDALCSLPDDALGPDAAALLACLIDRERALVENAAAVAAQGFS